MKAVWLETRTEREAFEARLDASGISLPLQSRLAFADAMGLTTTFLGIEGRDGVPLGGTAVLWRRTLALPGHFVLRIERFGAGADPEVAHRITGEMVRLAQTRRVLAVQVDVCMTSEEVRRAILDAGFAKTAIGRTYARSALLDLTPDEDAIFAGFHATARRQIRSAGRHPVRVSRIEDPGFAPRMRVLLRETFERTGGRAPDFDARAWIRLARERPEWVTIVGLFDEAAAGAEALLGYVLAVRHGSVAEYSTAASTRDTALKVPILYAPTWEAMRWARAAGAATWDFGGISRGTHADDDPRGGISDFKRYFAGREERVGYEFGFEPSRLRSGAARAVRFVGRVAGRIGRKC